MLLLVASQVGCGATLGTSMQLGATRTALDAQMLETARLERALMEAEAGARLPEANAHQPVSEFKLPPQIPVDDPGAVANSEPEPKTRMEPYAPVEPPPHAGEEDPWASSYTRGGGSAGLADTLLIKESIDRVARAIEQQTMIELVDRRTLGISPTPAPSGPVPVASAASPQLEALMAGQASLAAQLQEMRDEEAAEEAQGAAEAAKLKTGSVEAARGATSMRAQKEQDPRVAALELQLREARSVRTVEQQQEREEAEELNARHLAERTQALAEMDAGYSALASQQRSTLAAIEQENRDQRRPWQFWRPKEEAPPSTPSQDPAVVRAQLDALKAATRAEWDGLLARQEEEKAAMEAQERTAAADRAAVDARLSELSARMEQIGSRSSVDPAELARMEELAASVEALRARTGDLEIASIARQQRLMARLQPIADAGLQVDIEDDRARIQLPADVIFTSGMATLSPAGLASVETIGSTLLKASSVRVQIEGHTDSVPVTNKSRTNWDVGYDRARSVLDRLVGQGVPADQISAASFGDTRPVASNDTDDGRSLNRRVEIIVVLTD